MHTTKSDCRTRSAHPGTTTRVVVCAILALALSTVRLFGQAAALPPFMFAGRVVNGSGVAYGPSSTVEIRIKNLSGTLLAKNSVRVSTESPYNYYITVQVATGPAIGYATVGECLRFEVYDGLGTTYTSLVPSEQAVITEPGGFKIINFTLSVDANENGIPDDHENYMAYLMALQGITGPYDPEADSDGDGFSNRAEFLAGTHPLNAADRLTITAASAYNSGITGDGLFAISFITAAGRTYSVRATSDLTVINQAPREPFRLTPNTEALQTYLHTSNVEAGSVTIYMLPEKATHFYRIVVE